MHLQGLPLVEHMDNVPRMFATTCMWTIQIDVVDHMPMYLKGLSVTCLKGCWLCYGDSERDKIG